MAYQWPEVDWAVRLIPHLTGKVSASYVAIAAEDTFQYKKVKETILAKYEINEEVSWQRFREPDIPVEHTLMKTRKSSIINLKNCTKSGSNWRRGLRSRLGRSTFWRNSTASLSRAQTVAEGKRSIINTESSSAGGDLLDAPVVCPDVSLSAPLRP